MSRIHNAGRQKGGHRRPTARWAWLYGAAALIVATQSPAVPPPKYILTTVDTLRFTPDGKQAVGLVRGAGLCVFDGGTGKRVRSLGRPGYVSQYTGLAFSADGKRMAFANRPIALYDLAQGRLVKTFTPEKEAHYAMSIAFAPDGKSLMTGHSSGARAFQVAFWDIETGKRGRTVSLEGAKGIFNAFTHVACDGKGKAIAVTSPEMLLATSRNQAIIWDPLTGKRIAAIAGDHPAISPDLSVVATRTQRSQVSVWQAATGKKLRTLEVPGLHQAMAISPDNKRLIAATRAGGRGKLVGGVTAWDLVSGKLLLRQSTVPGGIVSALAFSPADAAVAACGMSFHTVKIVRLPR